jgi:hypothetical protein
VPATFAAACASRLLLTDRAEYCPASQSTSAAPCDSSRTVAGSTGTGVTAVGEGCKLASAGNSGAGRHGDKPQQRH